MHRKAEGFKSESVSKRHNTSVAMLSHRPGRRLSAVFPHKSFTKDSELISEDNRGISVMMGTLLYISGSCERHAEPYRRDVHPFETDTKGRLFVVDVTIDWPNNRNGQTRVLDSWKVTLLNLHRRESVNRYVHLFLTLRGC